MKKEMKKEKRLIDANEALRMMRNSKQDNPYSATLCGVAWEMAHDCAISCVEADACKVDAVEVEKYNRLVEAYHELRENFIDFVCSGIPNVAPYCLNRCDGCCDAYGWCRQSDLCQGFNPAEVILDGERKDNELLHD